MQEDDGAFPPAIRRLSPNAALPNAAPNGAAAPNSSYPTEQPHSRTAAGKQVLQERTAVAAAAPWSARSKVPYVTANFARGRMQFKVYAVDADGSSGHVSRASKSVIVSGGPRAPAPARARRSGAGGRGGDNLDFLLLSTHARAPGATICAEGSAAPSQQQARRHVAARRARKRRAAPPTGGAAVEAESKRLAAVARAIDATRPRPTAASFGAPRSTLAKGKASRATSAKPKPKPKPKPKRDSQVCFYLPLHFKRILLTMLTCPLIY